MSEERIYFDFTPDPRVLIALTHTPMLPLDAICELIDNSIDSFDNAKLKGQQVSTPTIWIDLPKKRDITNNIGVLRIRDNGPGMTAEQAEKAIKAGYSGNNAFDTLGLFGMGFNISTGKLGITTTFTTARECDDHYTKTVIDLDKINSTKSYQLEAQKIPKTEYFTVGTMIEISNWWPEGQANNGFVKKLVQYGAAKIRQELGRIYATILRNNKVRIFVDKEPCVPFEHCVWGSNRFVERKGVQIPARYDFDQVIGSKRRCGSCRAIVPDGVDYCPACESRNIRTVEEHVKGWVGIQRFDDPTEYGIDLIRNGRAIKRGEKSAFFEYIDEFKNVTKDYPIDGPFGRIVGEVHLDFVPVDFLKQDFQRSSDEWQRALSFLRGDSSLQPTKPGAENNTSYVYKLYQGYRKVRIPGKTDMYMGYWDENENKPKRFGNRDLEHEYYEKFLNKEKGYYDDEEWWKVVEDASQPPASPLIECPTCKSQTIEGAEVCDICGTVLRGKECINPDCKKTIPFSAVVCQFCESDQSPKIEEPWICSICGTRNNANTLLCAACGNEKGVKNNLSEEVLLESSQKSDEYSIEDFSIKLADGRSTPAMAINVYFCNKPIISQRSSARFPVFVIKKVDELKIFVDVSHPTYLNCGTSIVEVVASEIAAYVFDLNRALIRYSEHTVSNLVWNIMQKYWLEKVEISLPVIKEKCDQLMRTIKSQIATSLTEEEAELLFTELSEEQQKAFAAELFGNKIPLNQIDTLKKTGRFLNYVPNDFMVHVLDSYTAKFFNGNLWSDNYGIKDNNLSEDVLKGLFEHLYKTYRNSLETVIIFLENATNESLELKRVNTALNFLTHKLSGDL